MTKKKGITKDQLEKGNQLSTLAAVELFQEKLVTKEEAQAALYVENAKRLDDSEAQVVRTQFEYKCASRNGQTLEVQLNEFGKEGWELWDYDHPTLIFKRVKHGS